MTAYRYDNVTCSQCGTHLGPGDHGVSYCSAHGGPGKVDTSAMRKNEAERRIAGRRAGDALQATVSQAHHGRKLAEQQRDGLLEAAKAAYQCIGELSPTQARVEVAQLLQAAIEKAGGGDA